jgi:hypothetical protein
MEDEPDERASPDQEDYDLYSDVKNARAWEFLEELTPSTFNIGMPKSRPVKLQYYWKKAISKSIFNFRKRFQMPRTMYFDIRKPDIILSTSVNVQKNYLNKRVGPLNAKNRFFGPKYKENPRVPLYIPIANAPVFTRYEYVFLPLIQGILFDFFRFKISSYAIVPLNYYLTLRLTYIIKKNPYYALFHSYTELDYYILPYVERE